MNLFREIIQSAPVSSLLKFGHNENIILEAVSFDKKLVKGMPIEFNTFIKLTEVHPETRKSVASIELSFFNLKHDSDFAASNFQEQFTALAGLVDAIGGDVQGFEDSVMEGINDDGETDLADLIENTVSSKKGCELAMKALQDSFKDSIDGLTGDDSPLMKCKLVVNKNGFIQIPKEMNWILPMDSEEELPAITGVEKRIKRESSGSKSDSNKPKAEVPGEAPSEEAKVTEDSGFGGL